MTVAILLTIVGFLIFAMKKTITESLEAVYSTLIVMVAGLTILFGMSTNPLKRKHFILVSGVTNCVYSLQSICIESCPGGRF